MGSFRSFIEWMLPPLSFDIRFFRTAWYASISLPVSASIIWLVSLSTVESFAFLISESVSRVSRFLITVWTLSFSMLERSGSFAWERRTGGEKSRRARAAAEHVGRWRQWRTGKDEERGWSGDSIIFASVTGMARAVNGEQADWKLASLGADVG